MANKMRGALKSAQRKKEEAEFEKATEEFAKRVGPVSDNDLRVSRPTAESVPVQVFNKVAKAAARRKIN
jgi:hypothetical protein